MKVKKTIVLVVFLVISLIIGVLIYNNLNKEYIVEFDSNGGTYISSQVIKRGGVVLEPKNPKKIGYIFKEWDYNNETFNFNTKVYKNITLLAKWEKVTTHKVQLEVNGKVDVIEVNDNTPISFDELRIYEQDGFTMEWYLDNQLFDVENTKITKDIKLVGKYVEVKSYTVTFDTGEGTEVASQKVNENKTAKEPIEPTRKGYRFDGWYLDDKKYDFETKIDKDITLIAKWIEDKSLKQYTVKFDVDGGSNVTEQIIIKGSKLVRPEDPIKDGYIFKEWVLNGKTYDFNTPVTENMTLIARWFKNETQKLYSVTFNSDGGTNIDEQIVIKGSKVVRPENPIKEGYTFKEWVLNGKTYDFNTPVSEDMVLVAKWNIIVKYTVTFDSAGGSSVDSQIVTENGKAVQPKNPTRNGYLFRGWELNGVSYNFNSNVTNNITLVAKWEKNGPLIEAYFFNSQTTGTPENECIALKTDDGKVIVIDTANAKSSLLRNKIKSISRTIDYLIISHSHSDHVKNLPDFLADQDITIKNVIYKTEKFLKIAPRYLAATPNPERNQIDTSSMTGTSVTYKVNNNVSLILFNLQDVFKSYTATQCGEGKTHPSVRFASEINSNYNYYKYNGKYVYLNSLNPNDNTLHFSDSIGNINGTVPNRRYYAYISTKNTLCNSNTNSIAVLVEVKTENGYKYMYIPSDLGNNGYSFFGNERPELLSTGLRYSKIYATGDEYIYANNFDVDNPVYNDTWLIQNNALVNGDESKLVRVESESRVANQIRNYLGGNLRNIVIYQESHHGFNNAKDAVDTLELNRGGVYSIVTSVDVGLNSPSSRQARGYHYTLSNTTKLATGVSNDGVYCTINKDATYSCYNK